MADAGETPTKRQLPQRVQVVIRVRPVLNGEREAQVAVTAEDGNRVQVMTPEKDSEKEKISLHPTAKAFEFDRCLGPEATQEDVYEACNMDALVDAALEGYSVTVFAYGQTGSGKTHSIVGPRVGQAEDGMEEDISALSDDDGLLNRAFRYAFDSMAASEDTSYETAVTCAELYNDQVSDLFKSGSAARHANMPIRYDKVQGFYVEGLSTKEVETHEDTMALMHRGLSVRQMGSHNLNKTSTRSHCIMTLQVKARSRDQNGNLGPTRYGRISLVDLAGSERIKETGTSGRKQLAETGAINKSLFALGKVIAALCQRAKGNPNVFVPFRDSKLTQLLYSSLKGTGRALMLGCCAPVKAYADETLNTLHFASMALRVKSEPIIILDPAEQMVLDLKNTIAELRSENLRMAEALGAISEGMEPTTVLAQLADPGIAPAPSSKGGGRFTRQQSAPDSITRHAYSARPQCPTSDRNGRRKPVQRPASHGTITSNRASKPRSAGPRTPLGAQFQSRIPGPPNVKKIAHAPDDGVEQFPELAALEAAFQARLAGVTSGQEYPEPPSPAKSTPMRSSWKSSGQELAALLAMDSQDAPPSPPTKASLKASGQELAALLGGDSGQPPPKPATIITDGQDLAVLLQADMEQSTRPSSSASQGGVYAVSPRVDEDVVPQYVTPQSPSKLPEEKAVRWAQRNRWFGTNQEMTQFAYAIHEHMVAIEGISPETDEYYSELDYRMAKRFPGMTGMNNGSSGRSSRHYASPDRSRSCRGMSPSSNSASSRLRASIKAPLPPPSPDALSPAQSPSARSGTGVRRRLAEFTTKTTIVSKGMDQSRVPVFSPSQPSFVISGLEGSPKGYGRGPRNMGRENVARSGRQRAQLWNDSFGSTSYAQRRMDVLIDLKQAKDEAEAERQLILSQIKKTLRGRWH